jgi:DNA-binding NarL/FixJ family response regulator
MERAGRIRVVIVEDHALTRAGLRTALDGSFEVAGEAADGISGWKRSLASARMSR